MGTLPLLLVRSTCLVAAALVLAASAQAQIPIPPQGGAETEPETQAHTPAAPEPETQAHTPAAPEPETAPPSLPEPAPAPAVVEPRADGQPAPARADTLKEAPAPDEEAEEYFEDDSGSPERPRRKWYGWQTLVADGISTTVFFAAFNDDDAGGDDTNEGLAWAGILGYEFAPAIVHFVHRNPGRGFASMGIRLGMPLAGAFLGGAAASGCHGTDCKAAGAGVGFLLGMGGAIAIDAALLAFDYRESSGSGAHAKRVLPVLSLSSRHAFVGVRGAL